MSKSFVAKHIFSLEIVGADEGALLRERVAGACCGSKLPRVYRLLFIYRFVYESEVLVTWFLVWVLEDWVAVYCVLFMFHRGHFFFRLLVFH